MEKRYLKAGFKPTEIASFRANIHQSMIQGKEEKRRREERLDVLVAEREQRQREEKQKVLDAAKAKTVTQTQNYRELQSAVLCSKVEQENKVVLQQQREQKDEERSYRASVDQYKGGMLPRHEAVMKREQEREEKKERHLQSAIAYNREAADQKALEKRRKNSVASRLSQDEELAAKRQAQAAARNAYTEGVVLKNRRLEQERQEAAKTEEQCKHAQADLETKYRQRRQPKIERFKQQQLPKRQLSRIWISLRKSRRPTLTERKRREVAEYWDTQMQHSMEQKKKKEEEDKINHLREQTKQELQRLETERQKVIEKRKETSKIVEFNSSMIAHKGLLRRRKMMQEREEEEREAQRKQEEGSQYQDLVEKEIQKAVADQRIVFPLQAHKDKNEPTRLTFYQKGKNDVVLQKGKFEAREKKNLEQKHTDFKDKEKVEREHISLSHQVTNDFSNEMPLETFEETLILQEQDENCIDHDYKRLQNNRLPKPKPIKKEKKQQEPSPYSRSIATRSPATPKPSSAPQKLLSVRALRITDLPMKPTAQTNRVVFTNTPTVIQEEQKCRFPATAPKVIPKLIILDENSQQAATGKCEGVKLPSIRPPRQQAQNCDMPTPPPVAHNVRFLKTPTYSTPPPIAPMFTKKVPFNDPVVRLMSSQSHFVNDRRSQTLREDVTTSNF
ncbi:hypothetical protein WMY93_022176 [Mugilogobius chulae]|uniref:Uncharacterized protein n=1 Tax=Mugilogobius chulae TaxID=88201 RepID=A0AAW0NIF7_9GOBI